MFYFLIFHTSISANKELDKKLLTTFLYGCILYIVLHAILNSSDRSFIRMIKEYFWIILGLDVVCMLYIYKSIYDKQQEQGTGSQSIVSKLMEFVENFIDTSTYRDQIDIQPVPITTTPQIPSNDEELPSGTSILKNTSGASVQVSNMSNMSNMSNVSNISKSEKKNVEFAINKNTVHEFSTPNTLQPQELVIPPDNDTLLKMMAPSTNIDSNSPSSSGIGSSSIDEIRKRSKIVSAPISQQQQQQQPPMTFPPPISAKLVAPVSTKVKQGDSNVRDIKYDPNEFLNNIQYDTTLPSQKSINTNFLDQDDDKFSTLSKQSDLGSMLDFDLKDFADSI